MNIYGHMYRLKYIHYIVLCEVYDNYLYLTYRYFLELIIIDHYDDKRRCDMILFLNCQ